MSVKNMEDVNVYTDVKESKYGIYAYIRKKDNKLMYVGKDSDIKKRKRHNRHMSPAGIDEQSFHKELQTNSELYKFKVIALCADAEEMEDMEAALIFAMDAVGLCEGNKQEEMDTSLIKENNERTNKGTI